MTTYTGVYVYSYYKEHINSWFYIKVSIKRNYYE